MDQRYVSKELTHFVGRTRNDEGRYQLLRAILEAGWLTHPPHKHEVTNDRHELTISPNARFGEEEIVSPRVICFCDIPSADFRIHISKYGPFGIAFLKSFLVAKGASPVFYVAQDSSWFGGGRVITRAEHFNECLADIHDIDRRRFMEAKAEADRRYRVPPLVDNEGWPTLNFRSDGEFAAWRKIHREADEIGRVIGFVHDTLAFIKPFDSQKDDDDKENYYMEREWRVLGNINFELSDVRRVIIPESYVRRFRSDFPEFCGQLQFAEN